MNKLVLFSFLVSQVPCWGQSQTLRDDVSLSDPFIMADTKTQTYYMTGTGGKLWKSKDLELWTGPATVINTEGKLWMGNTPQVWASEIHPRNGKYYNLSTFTNSSIKIDDAGHSRRAVHVLQSNTPDGIYSIIPDADATYLPASKTTLDGTLYEDTDGTLYLVYCHEWIQNGNGTIEYIRMKPDMSGTTGEATIMCRASDASWNTSAVTDGPFLFRTQTGRLGMIWTSWNGDKYVQGVAYSQTGEMNGPWQQRPLPFTPDQHGHGMLFRTFDGQLLMSVHSNRNIDLDKQHFERHPRLFIMDDSGDELRTVMEYKRHVSLTNPAEVMVNNPDFNYGKNGWTCTTGAQNQLIAHNQSGAITGNFFESWDANSYVGEIYQELTVPNGTYQVTAAAFRSVLINGGTQDAPVVKVFANEMEQEVTNTTPDNYTVTVVVRQGKLKFGIRSEKKNFKWMGIDNVSIQYFGKESHSAEEIAQAKDQRRYLRNQRTGKFLNCGDSWGTKAVMSDHPLDLCFVDLGNGLWGVESQVKNGNTDHYFGANGYVDGPLTPFHVNWISDNTCTLSVDGTHYWGSMRGSLLNTNLGTAYPDAIQWDVLTREDLLLQLEGSTPDKPADATFLIFCPNFGRNDLRISQWNGQLTRGGDDTNMCAEAPGESFNIYQTIDGIPNGIYELRVQGFYRQGTFDNAASKHKQGNELIASYLYANQASIPLRSIFQHANHSSLPDAESVPTSAGRIPSTLKGASAMFSSKLYNNMLQVEVTDNKLTVGIRKTTGNIPEGNWTVFDNFELYYLGTKEATGIQGPEKNESRQPAAIYDLNGRKVAGEVQDADAHSLFKGVYIIQGKKVLTH